MRVVVRWKIKAWHSIATSRTIFSQFLVKWYNVKTKCDILQQVLQMILKEWFWFISSRIYCSVTSWMILLNFSSLYVFPSLFLSFSSLPDTALQSPMCFFYFITCLHYSDNILFSHLSDIFCNSFSLLL